jgi:exodeoxyribonuclease III
MKFATWNVNGIRARATQVQEWLERERPDVVCLQELKAELVQVPDIVRPEDYHAFWHCCKGYSGVSLQLRKDTFPDQPVYRHPPFDLESRVVTAELGDLVIASIYVPNGGKDYPAKINFLTRLIEWARELRAGGRELLLSGDLNIARTDGRAPAGAEAPGGRATTGGTCPVRDIAWHGAHRCGASDGSRQRRFVHLVGALA